MRFSASYMGPLRFVSMEFYKKEMANGVCSTMRWSSGLAAGHVHLRKGLISEA